MNNKVKAAVIFVAGAAMGSVATWLVTKQYYKNIADEEIASVKEVYSNRKEETEPENSPGEKIEETDHTEDYKKVLSTEGYTNYSKRDDKKDYDLPSEDDNPFVSFINDDEYGYEFETESLDFFVVDDVVINGIGEELSKEEVAEMIGVDWKDRFLNCGYETLYIRNTYKEMDYEIVLNNCRYNDDEE